MFIGTYEHTIDEKSRLTLPARFRDALGDGVVLARGLDGNVAVYPRETWTMTVEARICGARPALARSPRAPALLLLGGGRVERRPAGPRPRPGRPHPPRGLERDVIVAGNYDHLELWNPAAWDEHLDAVEGSAEHAAERLAAHGS